MPDTSNQESAPPTGTENPFRSLARWNAGDPNDGGGFAVVAALQTCICRGMIRFWDPKLYCIGGRKFTCFFVAESTSSGVMRTVIRDFTAPLALATNATAVISTLLGLTRMI